MNPRSILLVLICTLLSFQAFGQQQKPAPLTDEEIKKVEELFEKANNLMEQKKYREALKLYKEVLTVASTTSVYYNAGLAAWETNDYPFALEMWQRLKQEEPDDLQVRAKLIQLYQMMDKSAERDRERAELFELWKAGKTKGLADRDYYVREQNVVAGKKIMVMEHFELKGDRALRYVFYIIGGDGKPEYRISLGSYALTNGIWRSTTKPTPKEGERLFHLDGYYPNGHATYGMYPKEPTYDETRRMVFEIVEKGRRPISSSTVSTPQKNN